MGKRQQREYTFAEIVVRDMITNLIQGRFKWSGLPERLTSEQLERFICLWDANGLAVGFSDPVGGPMLLPGYPSGAFDIYWLPRSYTVTGADYDRVIDSDNCVPFYNDSSRTGLFPIFDDTIHQMARCWSAMAYNLEQQKNPIVFSGTKEEIESLKEANRRRLEYESVIGVTASAMSTIETAKRFFPTRTEFEGAAYIEHYNQILNRFLTVCGINNQPIQKRERLISGETTANNQLITFYRDSAIRAREEAANAYNKLFGASLNVEWRGGEILETVGSDESGVPNIQRTGISGNAVSGSGE